MKRYVFFCEVAYSYPILRPLQDEIRRRGDEVCWFLEKDCPNLLDKSERLLLTIRDVIAYKPLAIFSAGNYIYDFFPGVKVKVFHGYPVNKRNLPTDNHFRLRGWHDLLCTSGPNSTLPFQHLSEEYGYFKVYETGWVKADLYAHAMQKAEAEEQAAEQTDSSAIAGVRYEQVETTVASSPQTQGKSLQVHGKSSQMSANDLQASGYCSQDYGSRPQTSDKPLSRYSNRPVRILYGATFSKNITSAPVMAPVIERMANEKPWHWLLTLHPLTAPDVRQQYIDLAKRLPNVEYKESVSPQDMMQTDVLLCDSSSIIVEYMLLNKPVVTYRNTQPGPHLIDVKELGDIPAAIETALTRPQKQMTAIKEYIALREAHLDGHNCERVLDAVDDFVLNYQGRLTPKPRNLFRKLKLRLRLHYFHI